MSKFVTEISSEALDLDVTNIDDLPTCSSTQFISGALKACSSAPLNVRHVIQSDLATTLNCKESDLSFLWTPPVKGAEVLDCEIPDFRESFLQPLSMKVAAE
jgi:hypothetical protein